MHEYFYVGGAYVEKAGKHYKRGQMYVEHYVPAEVTQPYPLVFFAGTAQTGTNWMRKPDGGRGWAEFFLDKGYEVYITDQPARGRSSYDPGDGDYITISTERTEANFTNIARKGTWPEAKKHTQWPGTGAPGDPVFEALFAAQVGYLANGKETQRLNQLAGAALLDRIGPAILITHSQAGSFGWLIADKKPDLVKGIVALEPLGPPRYRAVISHELGRIWGITDIPMTYDPPVQSGDDLQWQLVKSDNPAYLDGWLQQEPARKLVNLVGIPIAIITTEASYHAEYDCWTSRYLKQAGVDNDYIELTKLGICGNGHLMFMEKNSDEIAAVVDAWLRKSV